MKYFLESKNEIEINKRTNLDFPSHLHEHFEIGYIEEGSVILIVDERRYSISEGDFFIIFPNQIHSYENSENIKSKTVIFSPHIIEEYRNTFSSKIPQSPVIPNTDDPKKILELLFTIKTAAPKVLKGFLLAIFGLLIDNISLTDIDKYNVSTLKDLLIYSSEHYSEGITISDVSKHLHISRYHIAHLFRNKLNTTFSEYITNKRIEHAIRLLPDKSLTIAEIAFQSGFNSLRSFNRNFLKHTGTSPKEYTKKMIKEAND